MLCDHKSVTLVFKMAAGLLPWLQEAADRVFCWHRGAEKPSLSGVPDDDDDVGDASETPTTTDAALVQRDVVKVTSHCRRSDVTLSPHSYQSFEYQADRYEEAFLKWIFKICILLCT